MNSSLLLGNTEVILLNIQERLRHVEELWGQLPYIRHLRGHTVPAHLQGRKQTIRQVKFTALKGLAGLSVGLQSNQEVKDNPR